MLPIAKIQSSTDILSLLDLEAAGYKTNVSTSINHNEMAFFFTVIIMLKLLIRQVTTEQMMQKTATAFPTLPLSFRDLMPFSFFAFDFMNMLLPGFLQKRIFDVWQYSER